MRLKIEVWEMRTKREWKIDVDARRVRECIMAINAFVDNFKKPEFVKKSITSREIGDAGRSN